MKFSYYHLSVRDQDRLPGALKTLLRARLYKTIAVKLLPLLILLFLLSNEAYFQSNEIFGVTGVIDDVKTRFRLTPKEVRNLKPLINQENKNVLRIYARFSGDQPEYSPRLWREIVEGRLEFEKSLKVDLTNRQRAALRAARSDMERRILNYLVQDYVTFLGAFLELDEWEYNDAQKLFESEKDRKHRLVANHLSDPAFLRWEIEMITEETERRMRNILSGEQWRSYRELAGPADIIASNHNEAANAASHQ